MPFVLPEPPANTNPLLKQFDQITASIATSSTALEKLNEQLANYYITAVHGKTNLDKQAITMDSTHLQDKLERTKLLIQQKRSQISRLRGEYDQLRVQLENLKRPNSSSSVTLSSSSINSWFTIALYLLSLTAIFITVRLVIRY